MIGKVTQLTIILLITMLSHGTDACATLAYSSVSATSSDPNILTTITDDDLGTCSMFPAPPAGTRTFTDLTLSTANWSGDLDVIVKITGENLGCEGNSDGKLYVIPLKTDEEHLRQGIRTICRLGTVVPIGGKYECTYNCSLSGDHEALRLVRHTTGNPQAEWKICEITNRLYIPTACGNLTAGTGTGGVYFSQMCDRFNGPITGINFHKPAFLSQIRMQVRYGSTYAGWIGITSSVTDSFSLQLGETINSVKAYYDLENMFPGIVTAFEFTTSLGNVYGPYGIVTPTFKTYNGSQLMFMSGMEAGGIDHLRFHFASC